MKYYDFLLCQKPGLFSFNTTIKSLSLGLICLFLVPEAMSSSPLFDQQATTEWAELSCPDADFVVLNNGVSYTTAINFENHSTRNATYLWTFGDGSSSTLENPSHTYATAGTYTVELQVTKDGCTTSIIGTVDTIMI